MGEVDKLFHTYQKNYNNGSMFLFGTSEKVFLQFNSIQKLFVVSNDSVGRGTGGSTQPMDLRGIRFNTH